MYCSNCGKEISKESNFCKFCGNQVGHKKASEPPKDRDVPVQAGQGKGDVKEIKSAIYAIYGLAVLISVQILAGWLLGRDISEQVLGAVVIIIPLLIAGYLAPKMPKVILPFGLLMAFYDAFEFVAQSLTAGYISESVLPFVFWGWIRIIIIAALFRGIFAAFKKKPV